MTETTSVSFEVVGSSWCAPAGWSWFRTCLLRSRARGSACNAFASWGPSWPPDLRGAAVASSADGARPAGVLLRAELRDAIGAEVLAPGIVPGGGVALARASLILAQLKPENEDQRFGIEIVRKALQTPLR